MTPTNMLHFLLKPRLEVSGGLLWPTLNSAEIQCAMRDRKQGSLWAKPQEALRSLEAQKSRCFAETALQNQDSHGTGVGVVNRARFKLQPYHVLLWGKDIFLTPWRNIEEALSKEFSWLLGINSLQINSTHLLVFTLCSLSASPHKYNVKVWLTLTYLSHKATESQGSLRNSF